MKTQSLKTQISAKTEKEIVKLIKENKTPGFIANQFGTFKHIVRGIAQKHKLKVNNEVESELDLFGRIRERKPNNCKVRSFESEVLNLLNQDKPLSYITEKLKVGAYVVRKVAKNNNIQLKSPAQKLLDKRNEKIKELLLKGKTQEFVAKKFGVTPQRIEQLSKRFGIRRWEEKREERKQMIASINEDINAGLSYEEILKKNKLTQSEVHALYKEGLTPLSKFFKDKRNEIIVEEFKKGKSANEIINSKNKFLKGRAKLTNANSVYLITAKNKVYKHSEIGNRSAGGCFEDEKILKFIKVCREDQDCSFTQIATMLNEMGKKTLTGKTFSPQNVQVKYNMIQKHDLCK
jgi:hypothetical protein